MRDVDGHRRLARGLDELADGIDLQLVGVDHQNGQEPRGERDRRKILLGIVRELLVQRRVGRIGRDITEQDRIAIRRRPGDGLGAEIRRRARLILDDDRLANDFGHLGADQTGEEVGPAAGRVRHHQMDGLRRIGLRPRDVARQRDGHDDQQSTPQQRHENSSLIGRNYKGSVLRARATTQFSASATALPAATVSAGPLRSRVRSFGSARTRSIALTMAAAASASPRCSSIMAPDQICPTGLAIPCPAMSGAEPCTGSNTEGNLRSGLIFPDGAMPIVPAQAGPRSERMSPNRFDATTTSKRSGLRTNCAVRMSMWYWSQRTPGKRRAASFTRSSQYGIVMEIPFDLV